MNDSVFTTVKMDKELKRNMKMIAAKKDKTFVEVVEIALTKYVDSEVN